MEIQKTNASWQQICVSWPHEERQMISALAGSFCYMPSLKLTFCPWMAFLSTQTAVNHRKVGVLSNSRCGEAGGNCELIAISFIPLCICQCRLGADGTDGDVILLLFMLRSHMVSIPVDMAQLCMPDMSSVNVHWGLQHNSEQASSTLRLLSLLLYCRHKNLTSGSESVCQMWVYTWRLF